MLTKLVLIQEPELLKTKYSYMQKEFNTLVMGSIISILK